MPRASAVPRGQPRWRRRPSRSAGSVALVVASAAPTPTASTIAPTVTAVTGLATRLRILARLLTGSSPSRRTQHTVHSTASGATACPRGQVPVDSMIPLSVRAAAPAPMDCPPSCGSRRGRTRECRVPVADTVALPLADAAASRSRTRRDAAIVAPCDERARDSWARGCSRCSWGAAPRPTVRARRAVRPAPPARPRPPPHCRRRPLRRPSRGSPNVPGPWSRASTPP